MATSAGQSAELHVVVGAGAIGRAVATRLAEAGHRVRVVTRSGSAIADCVESVAANAASAEAMARLTAGASAIYDCANPPYHRWPLDWPPIASSLLAAAEASGAVLVTVSNLYGYGPAHLSLGVNAYDAAHPMTETTPLAATGSKGRVRARMWQDALEAHRAGRLRATEVRASDYVGPGASSAVGDRLVPRVLRGRGVSVLGRTDRPHTWSYNQDVARLMVVAGNDPRAWGRAWHVPSHEPLTQRDLVDRLAAAAGVGRVGVRGLPSALLRGLGLFSPLMRELRETEYQFRLDFVMDSSAATAAFGLTPTPWEEILAETLRAHRT
ncbi:MAG: NAD-dependent epimerase/dehydratase family protein [Candidatus Dormibacteria bacterium]|jgi:nucleoside-diphosphate-sugar epimerase